MIFKLREALTKNDIVSEQDLDRLLCLGRSKDGDGLNQFPVGYKIASSLREPNVLP